MSDILKSEWELFARRISLANPDSIDLIRDRGSDVRIARGIGLNGHSVVIKLWNRHGWRSWIRRITMSTPSAREWRGLKNMQSAGLYSPEPLCRLDVIRCAAHTEAVIMQDLGKCSNAVDHLKDLIAKGDIVGEASFVEEIIVITQKMINSGFLDIDHSLPNFIASPSGKPVRLDFELIARRPWPKIWYKKYGLMVGQLIGSYVFAVQPDTKRVKAFAHRLREVLKLPTPVLSIAEEQVDVFLATQKNTNGIDIRIENLWRVD